MSKKKNLNFEKSHGQSLVEFALTLPLLLLLVFTFLDLGRAVYYYSAVSNAVREGARFASVTPLDLYCAAGDTSCDADRTEVQNVVQNYSIAVAIDSSKIEVSEPAPNSGDPPYVTVQATYEFTPITPFLAQIVGSGNTITLRSDSTMLQAPYARN